MKELREVIIEAFKPRNKHVFIRKLTTSITQDESQY